MSILWQDLRNALRSLRKNLLVSLLAAGSLALAIAGNTAVFSLVNALIYRPLPYDEPERITLLAERPQADPNAPPIGTSAANFADWRERARSFETLAAVRPAPFSLAGEERREPVVGVRVTPGFFHLLGVEPARGRRFDDDEATPGRGAVVILDHEFWSRRFHADPAILGSTLKLNDEPHTVIGILPEGFEYLQPGIELWAPLSSDAFDGPRDRRDTGVLGRLRPGVTMEQTRAEMTAIAAELAELYPEANRGMAIDVLNLRYDIPDRRSRQMMVLLQGAVIFVLLIACVNVANLLLARAQERQREIAMRTVLGAGRWRILRQLLTESVLLAGAGGVAGLALGAAGTRVIAQRLGAALPAFYEPVVDLRVTLFTLGLAVLAGLLFGVTPALQSLRVDLVGVLKEGGGRGGGSLRRRLVARGLVVIEIALALILLGGGSVMMRSFLALRHQDPGFVEKDLLTAQVTASAVEYPDQERLTALWERVVERAATLPGAASATLTSSLPQNVFNPVDSYRIDGRPQTDDEALPQATWLVTPPGYLETLDVKLLQGRFFERGDRADTTPVAAVNRSFAERHWPEGDAIGQRVTIQGASREIVGVVEDVRQALISQLPGAESVIYLPLAQAARPGLFVLIRATAGTDAESLAEPLRAALYQLDRDLTLGTVQTLEEFVDQFWVGANVFNAILGGFGALALFLAAIGTYGVLAYTVAQRRHEIGVRMAIGAGRRRVLLMVARQGIVLGLLGLALGIPGVIAVTRVLVNLLAGQFPVEPGTVYGVGALLLLVTVVASLVPAHRAASVDPTEALRCE